MWCRGKRQDIITRTQAAVERQKRIGKNNKRVVVVMQTFDRRKKYACSEIAKKHGGRILFTPPYKKRYQPIERLWALWKVPLRWRPKKNIKMLEKSIMKARKETEADMLLKFYRQSVEYEDREWVRFGLNSPWNATTHQSPWWNNMMWLNVNKMCTQDIHACVHVCMYAIVKGIDEWWYFAFFSGFLKTQCLTKWYNFSISNTSKL